MKKALHLFIVLSLFFASCTTQRIAVLKPDVPSQYIDREGFTTQKGNKLDVTFGYLFSTKDHLVFEVEVHNNDADSLTIDPQQFYYQAHSMFDSTLYSSPVYAHSFTRVLFSFDEQARQARRTATIVWLVSVGAAIALDVAANSDTRTNFRDYSFSANFGTDMTINYFDALLFNSMSKKDARRRLESSFLYPRTIAKSERHIGTVYFPRSDNAGKLKFNFKVGKQDFETVFKQEIKVRQ